MHDIPPILALINGYAAKGIMLPRTEFEMSEAIRDFTVVTRGRSSWAAARCISTLRRSARSARWRCTSTPRRTASGAEVVEALVAEAQEYELDAVFAFTYVAEFFNRVGFDVVERGVLPLKAWKIACAAPNSRRATRSPCCGFCGRSAGTNRSRSNGRPTNSSKSPRPGV